MSLKLLKDQSPGSKIIVPASTASPHPEKSVAFVTVAPVVWACPVVPATAVPFTPLVIPVKVFVPFPV